jgi:2-polyprenyl-6-methoxyphenol hydroxylase-like FAD-dependent oxidoreductase
MFGTFWRNEDDMMWSITHPDHGTAEESWSNQVTLETALAFTAKIPDWPEVADRVIKATPSDALVDWKLMWRDPQPKWTSPAGHVVQLGDAAHTFLPSSGNGATQAIEDGVSLAACVAIAGKDRIPDATRVHNLLRFERVSFLQALGVVRSENNRGAGKEPPMPGRWLQEHDPEAYAEENFQKALAQLRDGTPFQNTNRPKDVEYQPWTIDALQAAWEASEPTILDGDWS